MKWIPAILTTVTVMLSLLGCQMLPKTAAPASQPRTAELPPVPDRLRAFYQDIKAGKFEILADFEQPAQAEIFHVEGPGAAEITVRRSRIATGAGALEVRLDSADSLLVVDGQTARNWTLSRDWSRYQLLMASIYVPAPVLANLQIRSGTDEPTWWVSDAKPLQPGWNLVRIDLADVARRVNLADVRQIRLTVKTDKWPLTLYLDDLMLADNTAAVFGDPKAEPAGLYVLKRGHRYHVGSAGRFELVFSRGLLTSWYDLACDPDRTVDLAAGGPLGPVLTALDESGAPLGNVGLESWMRLGGAVQTHVQVVHADPLSVTIKGTIRFAATGADGVDDAIQDAAAKSQTTAGVASTPPTSKPQAPRPAAATTAPQPSTTQTAPIEHAYVYTIRQDGRVFVDISATVATSTFRPAKIGLAVTALNGVFQFKEVDPLDADLLKPRAADSEPSDQDAPGATGGLSASAKSSSIPRALLLTGVRPDGPNLLLAPSNLGLFERGATAVRQTGDVAAYMYIMDKPTSAKIRLATMLAVWPPDLRDLPTAAAIAQDYQQPSMPKMEVGRLRTDADGDLDGDGFSEATGKWTVEPDGQILRLRWPAGKLRFWPMLQVTDLDGKACWPYLDGRIIKPVQRTAEGNAEFVVPGILSRSALLEVTVEK